MTTGAGSAPSQAMLWLDDAGNPVDIDDLPEYGEPIPEHPRTRLGERVLAALTKVLVSATIALAVHVAVDIVRG